MRVISDTFIRDHDGSTELDETTRREVKIIEFLKNKSSQQSTPEQPSPSRANDGVRDKPHPDAQLLLGLHRSSPRNPSLAPRIPNSPLSQMTAAVPISPLYPTPGEFPRTTPNSLSAVQQLQQAESGSQSGSGSPSNEDESTAQTLLDQWCNVFSGGPTIDGTTTGPALPWATPGISDLTGWLHGGTSPSLMGVDPNPIPDVDGSDWSYWESLVNQIRSGPVA